MILAVMNPFLAWGVILFLGVVWVSLGLYWGRKADSSEGFMLAGRKIGLALGSATVMATWVTSNTVMLAPKFAYTMGIWGVLAYSTASFGLFLFAPMALRIRKILPEGVTAGDFFRMKYGTTGWSFFMVITLIYSIGWLVTMAIAGGELLNALTGISYVAGMSFILLVCVLYTLFGGLYAVVGTDFVQSLIILFGVVLIGVLVLGQVDLSETHRHLEREQPMLLQGFMPVALLTFFNIMLFGFGEVFHNNVWWSRTFAMREGVAFKAFLLSGFLWFPIPVAAGFIALSANSLGINVPVANQVGPLVAEYVLARSGLGIMAGVLILIVLFCSIASSIDSLLAATSDLVLKDAWQTVTGDNLPEATFRRWASGVIIGLGLLAWALALPRWPLEEVLYASGPLISSLIWPVIAGVFWKRVNVPVVLVGVVISVGVGLFAYFAVAFYVACVVSAGTSTVITLGSRYLPSPR